MEPDTVFITEFIQNLNSNLVGLILKLNTSIVIFIPDLNPINLVRFIQNLDPKLVGYK